MDSVPSKSFHFIFNRIAKTVDLKGAYTSDEIKKRILDSDAYEKQAEHIDTLLEHGAHERIEREFHRSAMRDDYKNPIYIKLLFGNKQGNLILKRLEKVTIRRFVGWRGKKEKKSISTRDRIFSGA